VSFVCVVLFMAVGISNKTQFLTVIIRYL